MAEIWSSSSSPTKVAGRSFGTPKRTPENGWILVDVPVAMASKRGVGSLNFKFGRIGPSSLVQNPGQVARKIGRRKGRITKGSKGMKPSRSVETIKGIHQCFTQGSKRPSLVAKMVHPMNPLGFETLNTWQSGGPRKLCPTFGGNPVNGKGGTNEIHWLQLAEGTVQSGGNLRGVLKA